MLCHSARGKRVLMEQTVTLHSGSFTAWKLGEHVRRVLAMRSLRLAMRLALVDRRRMASEGYSLQPSWRWVAGDVRAQACYRGHCLEAPVKLRIGFAVGRGRNAYAHARTRDAGRHVQWKAGATRTRSAVFCVAAWPN